MYLIQSTSNVNAFAPSQVDDMVHLVTAKYGLRENVVTMQQAQEVAFCQGVPFGANEYHREPHRRISASMRKPMRMARARELPAPFDVPTRLRNLIGTSMIRSRARSAAMIM